ncbi:MAG: hypothetical protein JXR31_10500 [Prolixibacteraceae bacterium]|nr:hypothetical protein [Prolixibacteraceae bacterium]MBN2774669.1 hypothetical protein [Prolixibacteraceae bacterium]
MNRLKRIYHENVYGVMGALIFHILLFSVFLLTNIEKKGRIKEEPVIIEFPDIITEPEESVQEDDHENTEPVSSSSQLRTNRAASLNRQNDDNFFDEEYRRQIDEAQILASQVNNQLGKETISVDDIKMPVVNTEKIDRDSIKNIIYTGESNITYDLENRYHVSLPIPVYLAQGGGKVTVDIAVDRRGRVINAKSRNNSSITDPQIYFYAELAAGRTMFNSDPAAPTQQRGTIIYHFIAQ